MAELHPPPAGAPVRHSIDYATLRAAVPPGAAPHWPPPDRCHEGRQVRSGPHLLTAEHVQALDEMKGKVSHLLPLRDPRRLSDEDMMMRFLIARQYNPDKAAEMLTGAVQWREQNGIDDIFTWAEQKIPADVTMTTHGGICGFYGLDQEGYPIMWEKPKPDGMKQLLATMERATIIKWSVYMIERAKELAKALNVDRYSVVIDLEHVGLRSLMGDVGGLLKEQSKQIQEVVPEAMRKLFIVNAPAMFPTFWKLIAVVLDKRVQEKVKILGSRSPGDAVEQWISPDNTPVDFGGTASVDWEVQRMRPTSKALPFIAGCPSYRHALLRTAATLLPPAPGMMTREATDGDLETAVEWDSDDAEGASSSRALQLQHGDRPRGLCQLQVGAKVVSLECDRPFALLRQTLGLADDFLKDNFDFAKMAPGGGKGGDCMARTKCRQWWVKDLNPGDYAALMSPGFLDAYVEHVSAHRGRSLLCRIVALLNDNGRRMIVMSNCIPQPDESWGHMTSDGRSAGWSYLMDLKGNRDDKLMMSDGSPTPQVHKRCWKCNWLLGECMGCEQMCCLSEERIEYQKGKELAYTAEFHMCPDDSAALRAAVEADVAFFQARGLMDYSAIIGVVRLRAGAVPPVPRPGQFFSRPYVAEFQGVRHAYYWGIIDFLQLWNCGKQTAHVIKLVFAPKPISTVNPQKYGEQFLKLVRRRLVADGSPVLLASPHGHAVTDSSPRVLSTSGESEPLRGSDPSRQVML